MLRKNLPGLISALAFCWVVGVGCQPQVVEPITSATWFPLEIDGVKFEAQVAMTPEEMSRGLMHRANLGAEQGMIFVFPSPGPRAFYMLNTMIPLSIAYISPEGVVMEIHDMQPHDPTSVRSRSGEIQYALEMNQGWFRERGIEPGAKLELKLLEEAVRQRREAMGRFTGPER
jgi:uncharacterized membrane protein (UPF0127 family)